MLVMFAIQLICILLAVGICKMNLIQISDIFWDTIPIIILPMILEMILAYQVFTKRVEDGTMDFILATDVSPEKILFTKAAFVFGSGLLMILLVLVIGSITKVYRLPGYWHQGSFVMLNVGAICLQFFLSGFCVFIACRSRSLFSYAKLACTIPVLMYVIYLGYYLVDNLFFLQYLTIFSLFRQAWYVKGFFVLYIGMGIYIAGGILFFYLGRKAFYSRVMNI